MQKESSTCLLHLKLVWKNKFTIKNSERPYLYIILFYENGDKRKSIENQTWILILLLLLRKLKRNLQDNKKNI